MGFSLPAPKHLGKSLPSHQLTTELTEQGLQWPHMTKNTDFTKTAEKGHSTNKPEEEATRNPGGRREADIQNGHFRIILLKIPVSNKKKLWGVQRNKKVWPSHKKREMNKNCP